MSSVKKQFQTATEDEDEAYSSAMQLVVASLMPVVMESAIELNIFGIVAKAGEGAHLSPKEIVSRLPTENPDAPVMLDRMLRFLASHSVLACSTLTRDDGSIERLYGLAPTSKYFVQNEDGVSLAPLLLWMNWDKVGCRYLKDIILEGGDTFERVHGVSFYRYMEENPKVSDLYKRAMFENTSIILKKVLDIYKGFENLKELIDLGGGVGTLSGILVSKYPQIKCVNFDLPHVIENVGSYPGVTHIGGDMLSSIPEGENIVIKNVLHGMNDEQCLKILKDCYKALPVHGKLILMEFLSAMEVGTDDESKFTTALDVSLMTLVPRAKQRTFQDFKNIANEAGFARFEKVCSVWNYGVIEFHKSTQK